MVGSTAGAVKRILCTVSGRDAGLFFTIGILQLVEVVAKLRRAGIEQFGSFALMMSVAMKCLSTSSYLWNWRLGTLFHIISSGSEQSTPLLIRVLQFITKAFNKKQHIRASFWKQGGGFLSHSSGHPPSNYRSKFIFTKPSYVQSSSMPAQHGLESSMDQEDTH
ncbi:hypothetical protein J437_LFUL005281 [Ladona fulva]|uniref:Uncharacterized protein n=1 Tax=Ladona fulva TaxID=123851 RepID=A0A8K0K1M2_LADFU|nr:hypothetical protein J437_LFUL005281 [Ladona fulva]